MTKKAKTILISIMIVISLSLGLTFILKNKSLDEEQICDVATNCIKENINYPSTFRMSYYEIKEKDNNYVLFYCTFKCKNGFGVEFKYKAVVKINVASDKYFATDFKFLEN